MTFTLYGIPTDPPEQCCWDPNMDHDRDIRRAVTILTCLSCGTVWELGEEEMEAGQPWRRVKEGDPRPWRRVKEGDPSMCKANSLSRAASPDWSPKTDGDHWQTPARIQADKHGVRFSCRCGRLHEADGKYHLCDCGAELHPMANSMGYMVTFTPELDQATADKLNEFFEQRDLIAGGRIKVIEATGPGTEVDVKPFRDQPVGSFAYTTSIEDCFKIEPLGTVRVRVRRTKGGFVPDPGDYDTPGSCACEGVLNGALQRPDGNFDGLICTDCGATWVRRSYGWKRDAPGTKAAGKLQVKISAKGQQLEQHLKACNLMLSDFSPVPSLTVTPPAEAHKPEPKPCAKEMRALAEASWAMNHAAPTRSHHQARLERRYSKRPLSSDKPEKRRRRWFWPAVVTLLTLISGVAGALTIYDRWPESVPRYAVMDSVPELATTWCDPCDIAAPECWVRVRGLDYMHASPNTACLNKEAP